VTTTDLTARVRDRLVGSTDDESLHDRVSALIREEAPLLTSDAHASVVAAVVADVAGLGPLEPLLADADVTEVMVNGPGPVWVEKAGCLLRTDVVLSTPVIEHLIEKVVAPLGLRVDRSSPLVDARLPDGSRVNAVVSPLSVDGPCLTIRRFGARAIPLEAFCPPGVHALLTWAVNAHLNILVSGGTGSGKTTLLNALAAFIPDDERVVTVEDAVELRLPGSHVVRLEARPANAEGAGEVRLRDLVRNALRMRPDRIVVGEVRGPEALDMLQAMNTGHEGSLSTCHANSPPDALRRLETMVLMGDVALPLVAVRDQVRSALDLIVQVARRPGGRRKIVAVDEVVHENGVLDDGGPVRTRPLASIGGLRELPMRGPRNPSAPPADGAWVVP
jgi:pilus assembly protein CpaF